MVKRVAANKDSGPARSPAEEAFLAVLVAARGRFIITRTKVAKLLYLADLEMARTSGRPATGVTWRWLDYGPFNNDLFTIENRLAASNLITREQTQNWYGTLEYRLTAVETATSNIDEEFWRIVSAIVDAHAAKAASTLRDITYQTPPMLEAQAGGERGVILDLEPERPLPDIAPVLRRLQKADMSGGVGWNALWIPSYRANAPPTEKSNNATMKGQK